MTPETLSCPYCNSLVLLPRLPGPDQQIRCPRCQEAFLYLGEGRVAAGGAGSEAITAAFDPASRGSAQTLAGRIKNRRMAKIILAVMAAMAGVAFLFARGVVHQGFQQPSAKNDLIANALARIYHDAALGPTLLQAATNASVLGVDRG